MDWAREGGALAGRIGMEQPGPYDPNAVSVWCGRTKIGYVPRARNQELAKMLFFGHGDSFEAYVQSTDWTQRPERQVRMVVYVRDRR